MPNVAPVELLAIENLKKRYPSGFTFGPANVRVKAGHTMGVMGPNGAGKTTFFQMITGNLDATDGTIALSGAALKVTSHDVKRRIGYLPQDPVLPPWATPLEIMGYAAALLQLPNPKKAAEKALAAWDCNDFLDKPVTACSYGMQKRVGLALASMHRPALMVLDEPFSGLDLYHVRTLENLLRERREEHLATIVSTHVPSHLSEIADELIVIRAGKVEELTGWPSADRNGRLALIEKAFFP